MQPAGLAVIFPPEGFHQGDHLLRNQIGHHRDNAFGADCQHRQRQGVVAREDRQLGPAEDLAGLVDRSARLLDGDDVLDMGEPLDRLGFQVTARAGRYVVEHQGQRAGCGDPGEMRVEAILRGPVVIGGDNQRPVGAGLRGEAGQPDGLGGRARAGTGQDSSPARGLFDHGGDHPLVLEARQGRGFSRRAGRTEDGGALVNLPVNHPSQGALIDIAVTQRCHQCDGASRE